MKAIKIGIIGDYNPKSRPQTTLVAALQQAAGVLHVQVQEHWIPTQTLIAPQATETLGQFDGIVGGPGDVYRWEGTLQGIRFARENNVPYIGMCAGFQSAVLEFARNVLGIAKATSAEFDPNATQLLLTPLTCSIAGKKMLVNIQPNSLACHLYGDVKVTEEYFCHFGINPVYRSALEQGGLRMTGLDQDGEPRILELPTHRFFIASLFVPQTSSTVEHPHPLIKGFMAACQVVHK